MGTTGPALFSDDLAMDIRAEFRELIGDGLTAEAATQQIVTTYQKDPHRIDLDDDDPVFWMALAATQWSCGRLLDFVKDAALAVIEAGGDVHRWEDEVGPKDAAKRRQVLEKLRVQLLSPQPKPKKIRPVYHDRTEWEVGHAVAYRLLSGRRVILRVLYIEDIRKDRYPIVDIADWAETELPPPRLIAKLPRLRTLGFAERVEEARRPKGLTLRPGLSAEIIAIMQRMHETLQQRGAAVEWELKHDGKFALSAFSPKEFPAARLEVIATGLHFTPKTMDAVGAAHFGGWRELDRYLVDCFALH